MKVVHRFLFLPAIVAMAAIAAFADGLDGYSVIRPSALSETDALVLKDMNGLLARSLGAELPVCGLDDAPAAKRIFFGMPPAGFPVAELENLEKVVVVKDGDVYLFGGGTNGTRYATYDFLQNSLGFRFFDARGGVAVPDLHKVVLTDGVRRHRFAFEERECRHWVRCAGAESALFFFRHGINLGIAGMMKRDEAGVAADDYCMPHPNCHSLTRNYLPRESIEDHPEYFSMRNGERIFNSQRCLSNPNVRQLLKKAFFEQLGRVKNPSYIDLSAGDTPWRFCECDGCAALERKYGTNGGPILDVFMEFCPEAARHYPRHRLMTFAYRRSQTQNPPTRVERMPDNFAVRFAPIEDDFSKDWCSPVNADTLADLKRWCQVCRKVIMWYYPNPYGYGDMLTPPLGNVERLANDMRIMWEAGVTGGTIQHDVGAAPMAGFTELQTYVIARLFDDIALDWRKLADEFINFEYGAAAGGVKQYLAELEQLRKETKTFFPWNAGLAHCDYLTPERLVRWSEAFDHMERMVAGDRARLRNLRRLRINLDYAMLCSMNKVVAAFPDCAPSPKSLVGRIRAEADEILADCYARQHADRAKQFVKWLDEGLFLAEIQSAGDAKPLPMELFGAVPKNRLFVTMPRSSAGGIRDDKAAAYGKAAVYDEAGKPETRGLPFVANFGTRMPRSNRVLGIGRGVDAENIAPSGEYRFYEMGTVELTRDCFVELGVRNMRATLNSAYVEGEYNKAKIYASLKFQGSAFYPADTNAQNRVWCDRIVVVRE